MENIHKSIIYGNTHTNRYGRFLPVCSSIVERAAVESILGYLGDSHHFQKYNRKAFAYRVEEAPAVFLTEKHQTQKEYYEGEHSDETIEGSGQKLLQLLYKFNIRNVFIGVLVQQFNPLLPFESTNYRAIVENCRLLLDELYRKVATLQQENVFVQTHHLVLPESTQVPVTRCTLDGNQLPPLQTHKPKERPEHIYSSSKPAFVSKERSSAGSSTTYEKKFLLQRYKLMKEQFSSLLSSLQEQEIQQLKYYAMYDKNVLINQVMRLMAVNQGIEEGDGSLQSFNFAQILTWECEPIADKRLKRLDEIFKMNCKLNSDAVMKASRAVGVLYSLIDLRFRWYCLIRYSSKLLGRVAQLTEKDKRENEGHEPEGNELSVRKRNNMNQSVKSKGETMMPKGVMVSGTTAGRVDNAQ